MNSKQLLKVLWLAFKLSFTGKLWKWLLGGSGSLIAILLGGRNFLNASIEYSITIGLIFLTGIFIIRFLLFFFYNLINYFNKEFNESVYGEAIILLKDAFAKVHSLRKKVAFDDQEFMETMVIICNNLKIIFDKITRSNCSVSIKVPIAGPVSANTVVENLCRDSDHFSRDNDRYKNTNHTILGNTAYQVPLNNVVTNRNEAFYYLNNSISSTENYQNTSKHIYPDGKLPYNSELVYPLIPLLPPKDDKSNEKYDVWGFLCVDSDNPHSFDKRYSVAIIEGVADGIYDVILKRNQLKTL